MTTISNETLMAFNDGELDAQAAEGVRAELSQSVDLQERLRRMQAVDELLRSSVRTDLGGTSRFTKLLEDDASAEQETQVQMS
jgi:anti-sigma factor RsiW